MSDTSAPRTRSYVGRLGLTLEGKISDADLDPRVVALNEGIKEARMKLSTHDRQPKRIGRLYPKRAHCLRRDCLGGLR
jgi:hypothetical protein